MTKEPKLKEIASRIGDHLRKIEASQPKGQQGKTKTFYSPGAYAAGSKVGVTYVSYQGAQMLDREMALAYLHWLDEGGQGTHQHAPECRRLQEQHYEAARQKRIAESVVQEATWARRDAHRSALDDVDKAMVELELAARDLRRGSGQGARLFVALDQLDAARARVDATKADSNSG